MFYTLLSTFSIIFCTFATMKTTMRVNQKYEKLRPWLETLPERFEREGKEIYHLRNLIKVMDAPDGLLLNVKRYHKPRFPNSFVYSLGIRQPKGKRAFEYPEKLLEAGFETPEPVAYIEQRSCGIIGYSFFVSLQCQYGHTMYEVANGKTEDYAPLMEALGLYTARLHDAKILHLDYTPGNILWKQDSQGNYHFSLVDINRMYFGEVDMLKGCENIKKMWGSRELISIMVRSYACARGFDENTCEEVVMRLRRNFWRHYKDKEGLPFKIEE